MSPLFSVFTWVTKSGPAYLDINRDVDILSLLIQIKYQTQASKLGTLVYSECKNKPFYLKTGVSKIIVQYNKTKTIDVSHHWSIPRDNSRSIGFSLTVNASPSGCGGTLTSGSGTIALPHVPDVFRFCVWHVNVPSGRRVRFRPVNVEFGESYTVPDDLAPFYMPNNVIGFFYYDIFDFRYRAPFTLITKPSSVRRTIDATGNKVIVIARLKSGNGFQLDYSSDLPALCGGVLEDKGTLRSPDNQTSFSCLWSKTISPHQTFALVISGIVNQHDSNARCNSTSTLSSNTFIVYNG
ncbi:hypothetical protein M8J75_004107 [Diaphorina citri]|nr:hypothetical protein M8J75_004107 [Diaphorina citri]